MKFTSENLLNHEKDILTRQTNARIQEETNSWGSAAAEPPGVVVGGSRSYKNTEGKGALEMKSVNSK